METNLFKTLVKFKRELGVNQYILGRISGINYMLCGDDKIQFANTCVNDEYILISICTAEQYAIFANVIEKQYPGLCVFNYTN